MREGVGLRTERLRRPPGTQGRCVVVIVFLVTTIMHGGVGAAQRSRAGYVHRRDVLGRRRVILLLVVAPAAVAGLASVAEVVAPLRAVDSGARVAVDVEVGDTVVFSRYGGTELKYDGEEYLLLNQRDILAVVNK